MQLGIMLVQYGAILKPQLSHSYIGSVAYSVRAIHCTCNYMCFAALIRYRYQRRISHFFL